MSKLRKPRPNEPSPTASPGNASNIAVMSRTMQLAVGGMKGSASGNGAPAGLQRGGTWFAAPEAAVPRTKAEQYWAARALVAETLLSAHDRHQGELAEMRRTEEQKRKREIGVILHANDERQRRLERLMTACLAVLLGFMCWLVMMLTPDWDTKGKSSKPTHFTIPILSPFASVVEHETGVFGTKAVVVFVLVVGVTLYAVLKHRLSRWYTQ